MLKSEKLNAVLNVQFFGLEAKRVFERSGSGDCEPSRLREHREGVKERRVVLDGMEPADSEPVEAMG